jgi:divalent metal cation (Fe/Co/Zn/Cd) transporter
MPVLTGEELLASFILFIAGFLIGLGVGKLLKGILLVIAGLGILVIAGFTIAGMFNLEELWNWFGPLKSTAFSIGGLLARYPALSLGLIVGVLVGAIK